MQRRTEDQIRQLCRDFVAETDSERAHQLAEEIRSLLNKHFAQLRSRIANHLIMERRRKRTAPKKSKRSWLLVVLLPMPESGDALEK